MILMSALRKQVQRIVNTASRVKIQTQPQEKKEEVKEPQMIEQVPEFNAFEFVLPEKENTQPKKKKKKN
jgi:hypothetical protein